MERILIIGLPGAGKTTLARQIARDLGVPHIEADRLFWTADRQQDPEFRNKVRRGTEGKAWVFEGHFTKARDLVLPLADAVVWIDPPFAVVLFRFLKRRFEDASRPGTLRWLLSHRRASLAAFRSAFQEASSAGVFTLRIQSGSGAESHKHSEALKARLGLKSEKS